MFEAYSSREHQSAVERLILLATGKKSSAPVMEEEPAVPEAAEPLVEQAEPVEEQRQEQAAEEFAGEHPTHEEQIEPRQAEAAPVETAVEAEAPVAESVAEAATEPDHTDSAELTQAVSEQVAEPVTEPSPESAAGEVQEQAVEPEHPVEFASEQAVEPAPADESSFAAHEEPHPEPQQVAEAVAEEHDLHHDIHEEAVEPALVESVLAEHDHDAEVIDEPAHEPVVDAADMHPEVVASAPEAEPVAEPDLKAEPEPESVSEPVQEQAAAVEASAVADAASEPILHEQAVDEHPHHEEPMQLPNEETPLNASTESAVAEHDAAEKPALEVASEPVHSEPAQEAIAASAEGDAGSSQKAEHSGPVEHTAVATEEPVEPEFYYAASNFQGADGEPYRLDKYMRRSVYRQPEGLAGALDVVPSPDETMFLQATNLSEQPTEEDLKELAGDPMWKTLMQFKGWLPIVTRVLPLLDLAGTRGAPAMNRQVKQSVDTLAVSQRELRVTVQDQTLELKRVEEEVSRLRDTTEKTAFEQTVTADEVKAMRRLLKNAFLYVGILLGLLVVAVGYMAFLVFTYLNTPTH